MDVRDLTASAYVLRFERNGIPFKAGQHILLGIKDDIQAREYSIYSAEQDDFFEGLIKEVQDGKVSRQLRHAKEGDVLNCDTSPTEWNVVPLVSSPLSTRTISVQPALAR